MSFIAPLIVCVNDVCRQCARSFSSTNHCALSCSERWHRPILQSQGLRLTAYSSVDHSFSFINQRCLLNRLKTEYILLRFCVIILKKV